MRWLSTIAVLASLSGCASVAPLDEAERARIRVVAPAAARFPPQIDFRLPPGKGEAAGAAGTDMAFRSLELCVWFIYTGPGFLACVAGFGATGAAIGAALTPSNEGLQSAVERLRGELGAPDVQQLLAQRFSERVTRLTSLTIEPGAGAGRGDGALVAELAVVSVGARVAGSSRRLELRLSARMRLLRPSDGVVLMTRNYLAARYGRFLQEYDDDRTRILHAIADAVDEVATLMVDDAFLRVADATTLEAVEPLPSGRCLAPGYDCWVFQRVPQLDTLSPTFRWKPLPQAAAARNVVYDLWIFGGEDDRVVEGLGATEHTVEPPLAACMRYSWAVRARFDTDAGPRTVEWSTASSLHRSAFGPDVWPTFGAPFMTPCTAKPDG